MSNSSYLPLEIIHVKEGSFFGNFFEITIKLRNNTEDPLPLSRLCAIQYGLDFKKKNPVWFAFNRGIIVEAGKEVTSSSVFAGRKTGRVDFVYGYGKWGFPTTSHSHDDESDYEVYLLNGRLKRKPLDVGWELDLKHQTDIKPRAIAVRMHDRKMAAARDEGDLMILSR